MLDNLDKTDQQNLIYLSILLAFLIGGIFFRRNLKLSQALKYLAWWALIAFVGIGFYTYRFEFSDFKTRILGEINPASAHLENDNQIVINLAEDGHFYIDTKINGIAIRFMIDTGASDIVINANEAQKLGFDRDKLLFNKRYETANGTVFGASVNLHELEIAGIKFHDINASINSADMGISLLGMSFLRQFKKYEFYQDRLVLTLN